MKNVIFYKFLELSNLQELKENLLKLCKQEGLKGKVLIAHEGINGNLTGEETAIQQFIEAMREDARFSDINFKVTNTQRHNFKRTLVKIRDEIITFRHPVDFSVDAPHLPPQQLREWLDRGEDVILVDARNAYEHEVGKFRSALTFPIDQFSEFPKMVKELQAYHDKKIVTYCTGGIRCEKAARYLRQEGFPEVYQLDGGIINYGNQEGDAYWEGKCFVFDNRGGIEIDPDKQGDPEQQCVICYLPEKATHICPLCQKEFTACDECHLLMDRCCSKFCRNALKNNQPYTYKPTAGVTSKT